MLLLVHALLLAGIDQLRLNETQFIKSHNSYHITTLTMSQVAELSRTAALGLESVGLLLRKLLVQSRELIRLARLRRRVRRRQRRLQPRLRRALC